MWTGLWPIVRMLDTDFAVIPGGTIEGQSDLRSIMSILWHPILDDPSQDVYVRPAAAVYGTLRRTRPRRM